MKKGALSAEKVDLEVGESLAGAGRAARFASEASLVRFRGWLQGLGRGYVRALC